MTAGGRNGFRVIFSTPMCCSGCKAVWEMVSTGRGHRTARGRVRERQGRRNVFQYRDPACLLRKGKVQKKWEEREKDRKREREKD